MTPEEMAARGELIVVLMTAPDAETAARLARPVVEEGLCACVNVLPGVRSFYTFEGRFRDDEAEVLCLIKTRRALYPALRDRLTALHPYDVPEIIALPVCEGNAPYLAWVLDSTKGKAPPLP